MPGSPDRPLDWSSAAADSLVLKVFPEHWDYYQLLRAHPSNSLRANTEFFSGDSAFQRDAYNTAESLYVRALAADSNFVLPPGSWGWSTAFCGCRSRITSAASTRSTGLSFRQQYRELIEAMLDPDLRSRFARYRRTVAEFPHDGSVRFVYADELFHRGALIGYPLDSAIAQFEAAVQIEPFLDQMPAWDHIFYGNMRMGYRLQADAALAQRVSIPPSGEEEDIQRRKFFKLAYDDRFQPWLGALKRRGFEIIASGSTLERVNRFARLGSSFDIPTSQASLGRILIHKGRTVHERANGYRGLGMALLVMGQPLAALQALDSGAVLFGQPDSLLERAEWRAMLPVYFEAPVVPDSDRGWALATLATLARGPPGPVASRAAWALAVEANARGDTTTANRLGGALAAASARHLSRLLGALQQSARGRPDSAIALTEPLLAYDTVGAVNDPFARSVLYLNRAQWFLAMGDTAAADATRLWYLNSDSGIDGWPQYALESGEIDGMLGVQARLVQAEFDLTRGRRVSACLLAGRVRELWKNAEPAFRPFQERASRVLEQCQHLFFAEAFRLGGDDDGDMGHALADGGGGTAGAGHDPVEDGSLGGDGALHVEVVGVDFVEGGGVGDGGAQDLADEHRGLFRREVQHIERVGRRHAGDGARDFPGLLVGDARVAVNCPDFRRFHVGVWLAFRSFRPAGVAHLDRFVLADEFLDDRAADALADIHHERPRHGLVLAINGERHAGMDALPGADVEDGDADVLLEADDARVVERAAVGRAGGDVELGAAQGAFRGREGLVQVLPGRGIAAGGGLGIAERGLRQSHERLGEDATMAFENPQVAQRGEQPLLEFGVGRIQGGDTETFHLDAEFFVALARLLAVAVGIGQAFGEALELFLAWRASVRVPGSAPRKPGGWS